MVVACGFGALLGHPASPVVHALPDALARRALMGMVMGLTAVALIYSPWGRRSGAHMNPAVTLSFVRLGLVRPVDGLFYGLSQVAGGTLGVIAGYLLTAGALARPEANWVATVPGSGGVHPLRLHATGGGVVDPLHGQWRRKEIPCLRHATTSSSSAAAPAAARWPMSWPTPGSESCCWSAATTCRARRTTGTATPSSS